MVDEENPPDADGAPNQTTGAGAESPKVERKRKAKDAPDAELGPPMKLLRDYRPAGSFHLERDGSEHASTDAFESNKVKAGEVITVPRAEARRMKELGIAERADDI